MELLCGVNKVTIWGKQTFHERKQPYTYKVKEDVHICKKNREEEGYKDGETFQMNHNIVCRCTLGNRQMLFGFIRCLIIEPKRSDFTFQASQFII